MSALDIRVGDVVRLKPVTVSRVFESGAFCVEESEYVPDDYSLFYPDMVEEITSRAETPQETIARLEAELAKAPRRIEWGGGSCPTDEPVVVWHRNGKASQAWGYAFDWRHRSEPDDIIAYMVLPQ